MQIVSVVGTYRRHGASSRNSASFLLRKVCVEVTGLKEAVAGLNAKVAGLEEENSELKEEIDELNDRVSATEQAGKVVNRNFWKKKSQNHKSELLSLPKGH